MTLTETIPSNLVSLNWPKTKQVVYVKAARLLLLGFILLLVSACAEPIIEVSNDSSPAIEGKSSQSTIYGREASFSYPAFSGNNLVATTSVVMTDYARVETFKSNSVDKRKLQVRFFYPRNVKAKSRDSKMLPVINKVSWQYLVGHQQLSGKRLRYSNYENAYWNIPINSSVSIEQQHYPVLIFSHGYGYNTESYTALLAELASKGYIVAAINHSYGANPSDIGASVNEDWTDSDRLDHSDRFVWAKPLDHDAVERYLPIWSDDQSFVIEQLIRLNSDSQSMFYQKLDLASLGLFGHSYGGAAAYHTAARDNRVKALIDIDGTIFNHNGQTLLQPFAFIVSNLHRPKFDFDDARDSSYLVRLNQFTHSTFTDQILWWQWDHDESVSDLGDIEALTAVEITSELIDDFFSRYLLEQQSQWFSDDYTKTENMTIQRM